MPLSLPKVRTDLEYFDHEIEGEAVVLVRDPIRGTYFKYNPLQAAMLRALDGVRTLDEMVAALAGQFEVEIPRVAAERFVAHARKMMLLDIASYAVPEPAAARRVIRELARSGLVFRAPPADAESALAAVSSAESALLLAGLRQLAAGQPLQARDYFTAVLELAPDNPRARTLVDAIGAAYVKVLSGSTSDFPTFARFDPSRLLGVLDRTVGRLVFRRMALVPLVALVALAAYCYAITPYPETRVGAFDIALAIGLTHVHSFLHELGHGLACYHFGGTVPEIGFTLFYYLRPVPYCDTSSSYLFKQRSQQVAVQLAGTLVSLVFVCLLFVLLAVLQPGLGIYQAVLLILWISVFLMFLNLIPFLKFDGYYALCDHWGVPNLRDRSFALCKAWLRTHLLGVPAAEEPLPPGKRRLFFGFAVMSALFTAAWIYWAVFRLLAPIVERFRGPGLVVSALVLAYLLRGWLVMPLWQLVRLVVRERRRVLTLRRSVVLVLLAGSLVVPWRIERPVAVDAELALVPARRAFVRAEAAGWIEHVRVREGERVQRGQLLAVLRNDALERDLRVAEARLASQGARLAMLRRGARPEAIRLARAQARVAGANHAGDARRAAVATALASTGLGAEARAASAAGAASVSAALRDAARWQLEALAAGPRAEVIAAAEAQRARAFAELEHLRAERARLAITSPIDGVVATGHLEDRRGEWLARGDALAEIHDPRAFVAELRLPGSAPLGELDVGAPVVLRTTGAPGVPIEGTVARLRDAVDPRDLPSGALIAVTTPFALRAGRAGMVGHARIYGARRSLAYAYLYLPLERVVRVVLWGMM